MMRNLPHIDDSAVPRSKESYVLEPLCSVEENATNIDDLLCEAVEKNSLKSVQALLDFALSEGQHVIAGDERGKSEASVSVCSARKKTPYVRAVLLAAQRGNYELIKVFLSHGCSIELPHDVLCRCWMCKEDPLGSTKTRIAAYSALCNPIWISLTSKDPFITAFNLNQELTRLQRFEDSYENILSTMKVQVQTFCTDLLDCVETTTEQYNVINMVDDNDCNHERVEKRREWSLKFIKCAFRYKLKKVNNSHCF